jgi:mono/diheme cytochrome c family protein
MRVAVITALILVAVATSAPASPADRGRVLYERGMGADGRPLAATVGTDGAPLPPAFSACANCHGADGRGRAEGGVNVPPITWEQLDKPYGATTPGGRRRAAYDESTFHAALTRGIDPSGHTLASAMPRYTLTSQESSDLAAYLRQIGERVIPGVSDDTIVIGWRAPAGMSATITARVLEAWCAEVNNTGGIFQRRLRPVALGEGAPPVFAVLLAGEGQTDTSAALTLARSGVPVLIAGRALDSAHGNERRLFALFPADANPVVAGEMPPQSVEDYLGFVRRHSLSAEERDLQLALLASARVVLEALKNTGRELDREKFLTALETLSGVETGFTPPASFTPRRHVATSGAYAIPAHRFSPP